MQWFLADYCDIYVAISTISEHLKAVDWGNKKLKIKAAQADSGQRMWYLYAVAEYSSDMFVFVDESGVDKRDVNRRYGWAPKGFTPFVRQVLKRSRRFNILPAITVDGLLDTFIYQGSTNREGFTLWLKERVLPLMNPFPGPRSVLVMDNASFHHSDEIYTMCEEAGVKLQYLPPYSPDFNPIEAFFSDLKAYIRRHARYTLDDFPDDERFGLFLADCCEWVGQRKEKIKGHFKTARAGWDLID
ncbi:hypothetical protein DL769_007364 [Monosporascus sp. CRB-8-3]|nr:hypothetical protein DL769_007364 [Monosporascus sp. CRB-8-3]